MVELAFPLKKPLPVKLQVCPTVPMVILKAFKLKTLEALDPKSIALPPFTAVANILVLANCTVLPAVPITI